MRSETLRTLFLAGLALAGLALACNEETAAEVPPADARPVDARPSDARLPDAHQPDAHAAVPDAARSDATSNPLDASAADARTSDAKVADATVPDVTAPDVTVPDAAASDAVAPDATIPDAARPDATPPPQQFGYRVIRRLPHDPQAFTQGLLWHGGQLYESTGLNGRSSVRRVNPDTGEVLQRTDVERRYFAEGLALVGDRLLQLTWRNQVGFVYDRASLARQGEFRYQGEGWGLAFDGVRLIRSDGSDRLYFHDPQTFEQTGVVNVMEGEQRIFRLNELEFIEGEIFANIWQTDRIVRVNPHTGQVTGWIDLTGLLAAEDRIPGAPVDVLNGIAWDPANRALYVTGKLWPRLYQIELVPR